jgi:hypothetical protein
MTISGRSGIARSSSNTNRAKYRGERSRGFIAMSAPGSRFPLLHRTPVDTNPKINSLSTVCEQRGTLDPMRRQYCLLAHGNLSLRSGIWSLSGTTGIELTTPIKRES